jgi:hypothetical protein
MKQWIFSLISGLWIAAPCTAQSILEDMVGTWSAHGQVTVEKDGAMQRARCNSTASRDEDTAGVTSRGRCAVSAGAGEFAMRFIDDGDGRVRAAFSSSHLDDLVQLRGTLSGRVMNLGSDTPYRIEDRLFDVRSEVTIVSNDYFEIREWNSASGQNQWRLVTELKFDRAE